MSFWQGLSKWAWKLWSRILVWWWQTWHLPPVRAADFSSEDLQAHPAVFGFFSGEAEWAIESDGGHNETSFVAVGTDGSFLVARNGQGPPEVNLRLPGGEYFILESCRGGGLELSCESPHRRWRLGFNGLLRETATDNVVHVKFSFYWKPVSCVVDSLRDRSAEQLRRALGKSASLADIESSVRRLDLYANWGHLVGTVSIDNGPSTELALWGPKIRDFSDSSSLRESQEIVYFFENGRVLHLLTRRHEDFEESLEFGYEIGPDRVFQAVDWHRLNPSQLTYQLEGTLRRVSLELTGVFPPWGSAELRLGDVRGWGLMRHWHRPELPNGMEVEQIIPCLPSTDEVADLDVVGLDRMECTSLRLVGGKAASLAKLAWLQHQLQGKRRATVEFSVPPGVVVTTRAYRKHVDAHNGIRTSIEALRSCLRFNDPAKLKEYCESVVLEFQKTTVSPKLQRAVREELGRVGVTAAVAVRSSALGEDGEDLSAAGQMDTFLGLKDHDKISEAIIKCWASQFSFTAVQYKRQYGQELDAGTGVVIQEMVQADAAGVVFSCDPVTGDPRRAHLTANFGLGQSVVAATADPDLIVVDLQAAPPKIVSTTIGSKSSKIIMADEGETKELQVDDLEALRCCISEEEALRLAHLALTVETAAGSGPVDVEWAIAGGRLYLLQARPVTTLDTWTEFDLTHEFDTGILTPSEYFTKANVGEVMPGASTPLSLASTVTGIDLTFKALFPRPGVRYSPHTMNTFYFTHNHVVLNMIDGLFRDNNDGDSEANISASNGLELSLFGRQVPEFGPVRQLALARHGPNRLRNKIRFFSHLFKTALTIKNQLKEGHARLSQTSAPLRSFEDPAKLLNQIEEDYPLITMSAHIHGMITMLSSFCNIVLFMSLSKAQGAPGFSDKLYATFASLTSNTGRAVESADVPAAIEGLVEIIRAQKNFIDDFRKMTPQDGLAWLRSPQAGQAKEKFEDFLQKHGHRCYREFDLATATWGMDPTSLVSVLQNMTKVPVSSGSVSRPLGHSLESLDLPLTGVSRFMLKKIVSLTQYAVQMRELGKSLLIKCVDRFRQSYTVLGEAMVAKGMLPSKDLVFYFTHEELVQVERTRSPRLVAKATRRKALQPSLNALSFPEIIRGIARPINISQPDSASNTVGYVIRGTPVCQGAATGPARVVMTVDEAHNIQAGDILVTYSTDIGWSPYFPLLAGVVTELGGLISHGAVVAREYGLPCIVAAVGATTSIRSGDLVRLDGTKGTLTRISDIPHSTSSVTE